MCGIVGYIGERKIVPVLIGGLERLEYRGYDSSGIAFLQGNGDPVTYFKEKGKIAVLKSKLKGVEAHNTAGIGHTRWATHGVPSKANAHPHLDEGGEFAIVQNGIVENYAELRTELIKKGHRFRSETDTEVFVHLLQDNYKGDFIKAFRRAIQRLQGFFVFVAISRHDPGTVLAFRRSNPLAIGLGKDENFLASDVAPLLPFTKQVIYPEDEQVVIMRKDRVQIIELNSGNAVRLKPTTIKWSVEQAAKGGYPHFMLKEIHEQPEVAKQTLLERVKKNERIVFNTLNKKAEQHLKKAGKIFAVSCGTAYHACMVSKYLIEDLVRVPVECWASSEFRYAEPIISHGDIVLLITQSGETADTLAALREAKAKGAFTLAVCNVVGATIARESDAVIYTHAGPEIGVASTKAYIAQLLIVTLLSLHIARLRHKVSSAELRRHLKTIQTLPSTIKKLLKNEAKIKRVSKRLSHSKNFLYLARGYNFPTALEGTLKLQEISYVHAHGYAAGEMKHGPIALVDRKLPVICICPESATYEKMASNIEEIKARKGILVSVITENDTHIKKYSDHVFEIPRVPEYLSPILTIIPLQLLAYYVAVFNGCDVDQPRNLAKSVTVE
jgi:glucosamine--fructose-6-phosphate aminotransferase (isomerizing)